LVRRQFELVEYRIDRTDRLAISAVDTRHRVDEIHLFGLICGDTFHRADFDARLIFDPDTGFSDYVRQLFLDIQKGRTEQARPGLTVNPFLEDYKCPGAWPE